ncbi:MAG: Na/Pi cotransporter family protein [Tepidimonas sp.]|uniref:Na/Pi cotransporter family protein n=1 Tax=Tepidimonas sp. TaxID=2002775 RepID=UPI00298EEE73|nr:Na/Pi cotransporter family protein [Tepidimonas sp.]MCS6811917.1 Na/Pi cotransporter family protein [Tepidimonas sp.]MCX7741764.1 Na/Pi cotransporter family protein [Tepidimonas sp.]MDW8336343.1 Na/Pi cotransporter family protein [Tepidimonas sp.]
MTDGALTLLAGLLGGVGLFLMGMELMTDGLRLAAGPALERILAASTATRVRGLAAGVLVTALVQSSSAVTVATIGFVNAGLLTLAGALWVLFGANVGTTMTGWIVAVLGFGVKIDALALPLIGLGVGLRLSGSGTRRSALGTALAGFGLLFFGIEVLKDTFDGVARHLQLPSGGGWTMVLAQLAVGLLLTVLMQSSSASLTVALSAAQAGLIDAQGAAAVVIGANIGTTVTAVIAALGATANARRAASAHVLFNVITGGVALLLLPWLVQWLLQLKQALGLPPAPALTVALFHTTFNVLGVVLMWPLAPALTRWLQQRFRSAEEDEARPRYLDPTVLTVPELALDALRRELGRLQGLAARALRTVLELPALGGPSEADGVRAHERLAGSHSVARGLAHAVGDFIVRLQRTELGRASAERLPDLLRVARYAEVAVEQAEEAAEALAPWPQPAAGLPLLELAAFRQRALALLAPLEAGAPGSSAVEAALMEAEDAYALLKAALLRAGSQGQLTLDAMDAWLRAASELRRGLQQIVKAYRLAGQAVGAAAG